MEPTRGCISVSHTMSLTGPTRSVAQLYRDCLRLVNHVAGKSAKGTSLTTIVRGEFRRNANVIDPNQLDALKGNATRALSNYLMLESVSQDERLKDRSNTYIENERASANNIYDDDKDGKKREDD